VIGVSPLVRSAMLPLLMAFPLWLALQRSVTWKQAAAPVGIAWLPFVAWTLYRYALGADSYAGRLSLFESPLSGIAWPDILWTQPTRLFHAFLDDWATPRSPMLVSAATILVALAIVGCFLRLRANKIDAWFLTGYVGVILLWPFPNELPRFLVVVYPCLLLCAFTAGQAAEQRMRSTLAARQSSRLGLGGPDKPDKRSGSTPAEDLPSRDSHWHPMPATWLILSACVIFANAPAAKLFLHRALLPVAPELQGDKREKDFFVAKTDALAVKAAEFYARNRFLLFDAQSVVPEHECIYAQVPQFAALYSKRQAFSYPRGLLTKSQGEASEILRRCNYYLLSAWSSAKYGVTSMYPMEVMQQWTELELISHETVNDQLVVSAALLKRRADHGGGGEQRDDTSQDLLPSRER